MSLQVIGSGFGRTGTRSLKDALETLGFGPCHHMEEVFANPPQVAHWVRFAQGEAVDWNATFAGYTAQVDWPGSAAWQELAAAFPQAKVVHSLRPDESWWKSFSGTIGKMMTIYKSAPLPPHIATMMEAMVGVIAHGTFHGQWTDKDAALAAYHARTEAVRAAIPPERLLVFDVAEGWGPLCAFLEVPVPETAFPHRNLKDEFWAVLGGEPA
ncbi:MAG: hypothetical protein GC186_18735 [Rhodobacteraceae bacterium]|nr:hypothetical protein [Paracoccaceae bacterium]